MATESVSFALAIAIAKTAVSVVTPHANVASLHHDREKQLDRKSQSQSKSSFFFPSPLFCNLGRIADRDE